MSKSNNTRSNSMNPNNSAYTATMNNHANQLNANNGTTGVNRQYAKVQGNHGKQLNPNQKGDKK